ncbi:hypothetical protein [Streptomyces sp. NRRL F-5126]|uniref:hypothetical protein n=1 Tax=Streptomyces sp. NRRL F-5126 TaxID=1463857 RepID=UPI00055F0279|nr:hypothetical protein [Streptomyces sp. NRRL F-5126]
MARHGALVPARIPAVVSALVLGGAWWWAVARLVLAPEHAETVVKAVVVGGWGLSLLPIHVASRAALAAEAAERARRRRRKREREREQGGGRPYGGHDEADFL